MNYRLQELSVLTYRFLLGYLFYFFARCLFFIFNTDLIEINTLSEFLKVCYYGLTFDTSALFYLNSLFLLGSILPGTFVTRKGYQRTLFIIYFVCNGLGLMMNYIDVVYYRFNLSRFTTKVFEVLENESNGFALFFSLFIDYWWLFLVYFLSVFLWIKAYKVRPVIRVKKVHLPSYSIASVLLFVGVLGGAIVGIRGDWRHSTRPISLIHAMEKVDHPTKADVVLNTPFTFIRTYGKNKFAYSNQFSPNQIEELAQPIKQYNDSLHFETPPNVVIFILESFGREYWGAMNGSTGIENYESFTPFLDSLAQNSLVFSNGFANGRKSIHGMSSVLASIPSFEVAYTSSQYSTQQVQSIVSISKEMGYNTSFFHGAPNGSMGFLGFSQVLGFDAYYGKNEYNNDDDFDGVWGIWDDPFFQFTKRELSQKKTPFLTTIFSVSSHAPFKIPEQYQGKFKEGYIQMHPCVQYTDYALKRFFEESKKEAWFQNTLFVFTADHGNQSYYEYYQSTVNRFANPIMFYSPNKNWNEERFDLAQHMDIMPTIAHMIGYRKPIRSWGRSLVSDDNPTLIINYFGAGSYFFMDEEYICVYNGEKATGFYNRDDYGFQSNIIDNRTSRMDTLVIKGKAFLQDYNKRIVEGKLGTEKE